MFKVWGAVLIQTFKQSGAVLNCSPNLFKLSLELLWMSFFWYINWYNFYIILQLTIKSWHVRCINVLIIQSIYNDWTKVNNLAIYLHFFIVQSQKLNLSIVFCETT